MRHKINFVLQRADDVLARCRDSSPDDLVRAGGEMERLISSTGLCWLIVTHARLRERGETNIALSSTIDPDAINIAHADTIVPVDCPLSNFRDAFVVSVRGEFGHRFFAQFEIVQNRLQEKPRAAFIPHWPQPGLIARTEPPSAVRRIAFVGQIYPNLAANAEQWSKMLGSRGYEFISPERDWHDLSSYDVMVGVRGFNRNGYNKKPPSKLLNAWHAGIPFIGGHDSAFKQVGTPGEDYLIASSFNEVADNLDRLSADPGLRNRLIQNGRRKAERYSNDAITRLWLEALDGPIADRFEMWQHRRVSERARTTLLYHLDSAHMRMRGIARKLVRAVGMRL